VKTKSSFFLLTLALLLLFTSSVAAELLQSTIERIRCASTTSTQNSGLFDYILPQFEKKTGIKVDVVAVGTGAAIELGKRGDADVVFVHAKELELKAVEQGYFVDRYDVMYNDFVVIGPPVDPARIKGMESAAGAFNRIAKSGNLFVSRGDKSGTHMKELYVWKQAILNPGGNKWYLEIGQGMAKAQRIANEKRAYTLTDRGTWLASKDKDKLEMAVLVEGDPILFNQYGIMAVNPERHSHIKYGEAKKFITWLISKEGQKAISAFKDKRGNRLFTPNAKK
jgi:tungstate transport system substrate-binding protein